ncbi:riboflavin biosynthesis protein RibD [Kribbella antibiotica]|uniref:Riboflavin biosynthesis protein RibD n=1 Tax=Kribbella antibiotica TaxID=190195 RepID=A0A4R4YZP9_9ACTN|nr:dihydrofolate reductase family protein [Kribbella antibiotica]TDD49979.1 riboflavin biosynthesis protein RibD [Kribbella antibiotica]
MSNRLVTANLALSLDGHYHGAGGPPDFGQFIPYVATDVARAQLTRIHENATTAVLGRTSAEGFLGYWSSVAEDNNADPRDRGYAQWLVAVEKVVFSTRLTDAPGDNSRLVDGSVVDIVTELKSSGEGDILVNSSPAIIKPLLASDAVDRLYLMIFPELTGGGERLFDNGIPSTKWSLTHQETGATGELALVYTRAR